MDGEAPALATVDVVIIVGFLLLVTLVGFVLSRAASEGMDDYFLGGRTIPWWVLGISTSASSFDLAGTMILVAVVFSLGVSGFLVEIRGGVGLSLAFLMVFLGKWLRRSRVMTSAEWMTLRFGTDTQGRAAHLLSASANILLSLGVIVFLAKGAGTFLTHFLPLSEVACTSGMVLIGLSYTLMSGLYGVVFTDVIQMIPLSFTALYVSVKAFGLRATVALPLGFLDLSLERPALGAELLQKDPSEWGPIFDFFALCVVVWVARTVMQGMGGVGGHTEQRFFATRSEREASLLTLQAMVLSLMRWTMVAGLVVMGYDLVAQGGPAAEAIAADSEQVLPIVLSQVLPPGVKGFVIAGLIAAAMSAFDSTLNAGASTIVRDLYESYVNPEASSPQLMRVSRWATVGLCVAGMGVAAVVPSIHAIWGVITMGLGAGLFVPLFLRWYWPRFNGFGFAAGTVVGIVAALVFNAALGWPLYLAFPAVVGSAFVVAVLSTLLSAPTDEAVLRRFNRQINPWGLWGAVTERMIADGELTREEAGQRLWEKINDTIAVCFAVPFQVSLLMSGMTFVFRDWERWSFWVGMNVLCSVGLYVFWFRTLKSDAQCTLDDAEYGLGRAAVDGDVAEASK